MEKIENLVTLLGKFGDQLGHVKDLLGDMEIEVRKHTTSLKGELVNFKNNLNTEEFKLSLLSNVETEIHNHLTKLRKDLYALENIKQEKEASLKNNKPLKSSRPDINIAGSIASSEKSNSSHSSDRGVYKCPVREVQSPVAPVNNEPKNFSYRRVEYQRDKLENNLQTNSEVGNWWNDDYCSDDETKIDWQKEYAEQQEMQYGLMLKEGWKKSNSTVEELEKIFKDWTGIFIKWSTARAGKAKNGKPMFLVIFENLDDRKKIFDMRKQIAEEGLLSIGEALTYVERRERWKMLVMAEKLKSQGVDVEFQNKRMRVENEWWKYCYRSRSWKKL